jgi:hypothetical protein
MAGDWIKMRSDLFTHPKVVRISSALKADTLRTVGGLMSAWCLFDAHSIDGNMDGYTPQDLDNHLRWPGFSAQIIAVGWLIETDSGLVMPRFDSHNGQSAKRRSQDSDRKKAVRKTSASEADKKRTREEKRREEKKIEKGCFFESFWKEWPSGPRKQSKGKCLDVWKKINADQSSGLILAHLEVVKTSDDWLKDNGRFVPAPMVYLNQRRWEGFEITDSRTTKQNDRGEWVTYFQDQGWVAASIDEIESAKGAS